MNGAQKNSTLALYRTLWRWHFYAGIFCLPFVLTLALSGTVYLFKPQVDAWLDAPYRNLIATGPRTSASEQITAVLAHLPESRFVNYRLPQSTNDAVVITVQQEARATRVYVNPFTLEILRTAAVEEELMQVVKRFHGELLAGDVGSILVELAGCWAIVLIITGLYLWWPRNADGLAGVLYPRLNQGKRLFWRDLHAVTGIWVSGFTLFLLITGLPWALVWGGALKELRQQQDHAHHSATPDWGLRSAENLHGHDASGGILLPEILVQNAAALKFAPPAELSPAVARPGEWTLQSQTQNRPLRAEARFDGKTGELLRTQHFAEKKAIDRIIGVGIAAHEGQLFGWFNQLLGLLTTTGLMWMSISAFVLWRRRKPTGTLGAPPPFPQSRIGNTIGTIILLLALLLPLLALSIVSLVLLEWLVLRRLQGARRWLGLTG